MEIDIDTLQMLAGEEPTALEACTFTCGQSCTFTST